MTCPYADNDAAYVLGALDPTEQQSYRAHLSECPRCRASVQELTAMPGYLARLLPGADAAIDHPATPTLLPGLARRVRRQRRVVRWRMLGAALVVAAAAAAAGLFIGLPEPADRPGTVVTMSAEPGIPVEATLIVTGRGWGTSIDAHCRYDGIWGTDSPEPTYLLYAIDGEGIESVVSSWRQLAGREITVPGATRLDLADIDRLEVRTAAGQTLLWASL